MKPARKSKATPAAPRAAPEPNFHIPNSPLPGIVWPALPMFPGALQLALHYQFEQTQWWSPERLQEMQFRQLGALLEYAAREAPFYRDRLALRAGAGRPLDAEAWAALPILKRAEIQEAGDALFTRTLPQGHGPVGLVTTSGSTGRPITVRGSRVANIYFVALNTRNHLWHRRDLSAKYCSIRHMKADRGMPPRGLRGGGWALGFPTGSTHTLNVFSPLDDQIDWIVREAPGYLMSYPTNLDALARRMTERGVTLPSLKDVITFGEAITPEIRSSVSGALGVPVVDIYSSMEVGVIALQCPGYEHYHVMSENLLVEVLRGDGTPCAPGEIGRVVLTPLHNFATPMIRYEIGDHAEVGSPCECGRGLPVLRRIFGRTRNMLTLPDGEQRWPGIKFSDLAQVVPLRQIQFVQRARDAIDVKLVVPEPVAPAAEQRLRAAINEMLGAEFNLNVLYVDDIPRSAGGKYEDFKSEIA
jgi:phenylacetate-CoA ligase